MNKNELIKSGLHIFVFWYVAFFFIWLYGVWKGSDVVGVDVYDLFFSMEALFPFLNWSILSLSLGLTAFLIGVLAIYFYEHNRIKMARKKLERKAEETLLVTLLKEPIDTSFVAPKWRLDYQTSPFVIDSEPHVEKLLSSSPPIYTELLIEVFSLLKKNEEAFVGNGHVGTLYDHSLRVVNAVPKNEKDVLSIILAAGHDLGKILSHVKNEGQWERVGNHDDLSALIISQLPSFHKLPTHEKTILSIGLKYSHKISLAPELPEDLQARFDRLFKRVKEADNEATKKEKEEKRQSFTESFIKEHFKEAFLQTLPDIVYQQPNIKKNTNAAGHRKGNRHYFLLSGFIKVFSKNIDPDLLAVFNEHKSRSGKLSKLSNELISVLDGIGWIIKSADEMVTSPAIWKVQSKIEGSEKFVLLKDVIIVDVPDDYQSVFGPESHYELTVVEGAFKDSVSIYPPKPKKEIAAVARLYSQQTGTAFKLAVKFVQDMHEQDIKSFYELEKDLKQQPEPKKFNEKALTRKQRSEAKNLAASKGIPLDQAMKEIFNQKYQEQLPDSAKPPKGTPQPNGQNKKERQVKKQTGKRKQLDVSKATPEQKKKAILIASKSGVMLDKAIEEVMLEELKTNGANKGMASAQNANSTVQKAPSQKIVGSKGKKPEGLYDGMTEQMVNDAKKLAIQTSLPEKQAIKIIKEQYSKQGVENQ